jgi:hypothetical protein
MAPAAQFVMSDSSRRLAAYRASVDAARAWFTLHHSAVDDSFEVLNSRFEELGKCLQHGRDAQNHTHVSLAPLLLICQRQAFIALDLLRSRQAYQAWLILRPGIEAVLIMGKWVEDVRQYLIWQNRHKNKKEYSKQYSGSGLETKALPNSKQIRRSLSTINDYFAHPNTDYYFRHTKLTDLEDENIELELKFFDDDGFHWASVLGMLHLLITVQESIAKMFFLTFVNVDVRPEGYGLKVFEDAHNGAATTAARRGSIERAIIYDIGLWNRQ